MGRPDGPCPHANQSCPIHHHLFRSRPGQGRNRLPLSRPGRPRFAHLARATTQSVPKFRRGWCVMNGVAGPAWILMFFLVLIVFAAIAAIIWRSWIVGTIVLVLVLLIGGFLFTYHVAQVPSTVTVKE